MMHDAQYMMDDTLSPISYHEIEFLISFKVKNKRDRKSNLVRDRIFNLIWSTIEM